MTSNENALKQEFDYYLSHQAELAEKYRGRFVVIHGQSVVGDYNDATTAFQKSSKLYPVGTFLVQKAEPGKESVTQVYHSRVVLAR